MEFDMKKAVVLIVLFFALALPACTKKQPEAPPAPLFKVGVEPIKPQLPEQDTFNISYWLGSGVRHHVLVRLSSIDGLVPVDENSLAAINKAVQARDYRGLLAMGDTRTQGALYAPENVVYLAHRLGMVDDVYWVVPVFGSITQQDVDGFKEDLKKRLPAHAKEIDTIVLKDKIAQGEIGGVPLKIMGLQDIPTINKPLVIDIDLTYLAALYQGEKNTRILSFVSGFFKTLKERSLAADAVTLSASNNNNLVSLKFRFLVRYLSELFAAPGMIEGPPPSLWSERADAWKTEQKSPKESVSIYRNILKKYPQDAASHYDLSSVYFGLGDLEGCKRELAEAVRIDPGYWHAYVEYASRLANNGKKKEADAFMTVAGDR